MNQSPACTPAPQPTTNATEREHPRYAEYQTYRTAMVRQLVTGSSFALWLAQTEEFENGREIVFQVTRKDATLTPGWYKNKFGRCCHIPVQYGPFATEAEAGAA